MQLTAPRADEFELSLFGCGTGESAVLHLGHGRWAIVDSCRTSRNSEPLPLAYLRDIGVDVADAVKLLVLTHWHDDHVDGASKIAEACVSAQIVCSAAFAVDEFSKILGLYNVGQRLVDHQTSGVRELGRIYSIVGRRIEESHDTSFALKPAQADQLLYKRDGCELVALAPSHGSQHVAREQLAALFSDLLNTQSQALVVPRADRNDYSIALWLRWGDLRVLLGGDLEVSPDEGRGWGAVLKCQQLPDAPAQVHKIAHHGSPNGDDPRIWESLLVPQPYALLTSYSAGPRPRPDEHDLARIQARTSNVYYTALPRQTRIRRNMTVEKEMQSVVRRRRTLNREAGHVRLRWLIGAAAPEIELAGTARQVA